MLRDSNRSGIPPAADEEEVRDVQKQARRTLASAGHLLESGYSAVNDLFSQTVKLAAASGSTDIDGTGASDRVRRTGGDGPVCRGAKRRS